MATSKLASALIQQPPQILNPVKKKPAPLATAAAAPAAPPAAAPASTAQTTVNTLLQPFLNEINAAADRRSQAGTAAITGYTNDLAAKLGGINLTSPYTAAEGRQASADAALQQSLTGGGTQLASDLNTRLASINDPAVAQAASGLASRGAALGTTELARGTTSLGNLFANEAAAGSYGKTLPGIAGLSGLQGVKQLQSQIAGDSANKVGSLEAQVPGMVQNELAAEAKAKQDAAALAFKQQQQQDLNAYRNGQLGVSKMNAGTSAARAAASSAQGDARLGISQQNANTAQQNADTSQYRAITAAEAAALKQTQAAKGPKPTAGQVQKTTATAATIAQNAFKGFETTDKNGVVTKHPPLNYQDALTEMRKEGVTGIQGGLDIAQNALDSYYAKGHRSRPWLSIQERQNLIQNGAPVNLVTKAITSNAAAQALVRRYGGKGEAAQDAAYVTVAPTADRPGVGLSPTVVSFVGRIGQAAGQKLTIGTGTNHNEYVVGTNRVSDHWGGHAADIPASGSELTRLGRIALVQAGMPPAEAMRQTGGLFNVGGYQIIFNSMEGGNHFNHLHVGVRGGQG